MSNVDTSAKISKISVTTSRLSKLLDSQLSAIRSVLSLWKGELITILPKRLEDSLLTFRDVSLQIQTRLDYVFRRERVISVMLGILILLQIFVLVLFLFN